MLGVILSKKVHINSIVIIFSVFGLFGCQEKNVNKLPELQTVDLIRLKESCQKANGLADQEYSISDGVEKSIAVASSCKKLIASKVKPNELNEANAMLTEAEFRKSYYSDLAKIEDLAKSNEMVELREIYQGIKDRIRDRDREMVEGLILQSDERELYGGIRGLSDYAKSLRREYKGRINYKTVYARKVVDSFNIDCNSNDKRYLPLSNILYAKLAALDNNQMHLEIEVDSRDDDVRITDYLVGKKGEVVHSSVSYEINKWGELRAINTRLEAIKNSCFHGYGEIWVFPY